MGQSPTGSQGERKPFNALRHFGLASAIAASLLVIYFASAAPAFIMSLKSEQMLSHRSVRRAYRPLFDFVPDFTCCYLRQCGVSDLEIFFVMQASKGEAR